MRLNFCLLGCLLLIGTPGQAEVDYVTDPEICPFEYIDRSERGMTFNGQEFFEIEYFCELAEALPPVSGRDVTHVSAGYCEEPGALFPTVFVIRSFQSEPGILYVYEGDTGAPTTYFSCRN